jgi:hypothetical protein
MDRAPTPTPAPAKAGFDHPEEQIQRSLFGEILDWMLVPLLLLWPISIGITYVVAKNIANQPFDRALDDRVTVLAQQVKEVNGRLTVPLPAAARDMLSTTSISRCARRTARWSMATATCRCRNSRTTSRPGRCACATTACAMPRCASPRSM